MVDELRVLNMNSYEYQLFRELLQRDPLTVQDIFLKTTIPRCRIYDVAQSLAKNGLCKINCKEKVKIVEYNRFNKKRTRYMMKPLNYQIIPLEEARKILLKKIEEENKFKIEALEKIYGN